MVLYTYSYCYYCFYIYQQCSTDDCVYNGNIWPDVSVRVTSVMNMIEVPVYSQGDNDLVILPHDLPRVIHTEYDVNSSWKVELHFRLLLYKCIYF